MPTASNDVPVLQIAALPAEQEKTLAARYRVHRALTAAEREAAVAKAGRTFRAVVTGGHLGISNALIDQLPALEIVAINGVGFDRIDLGYARGRGLRVTNTPDVLTDDVADLAIGLVVSALRRIPQSDAHVRAGRWPAGDMPLARRVSAQRFGIFGLGRIGRAIARRLEGFGVPIAYAGRTRHDVPYEYVPDLIQLARQSDVLILAAATNPETTGIVDRRVLDALGPHGVLVNIARGALVDEAALTAAVTDGRLGGAALDVFVAEPNVPDPLRTAPNVVLTPHIGSATAETRAAMANLVLDNLAAHFSGAALPTAVV